MSHDQHVDSDRGLGDDGKALMRDDKLTGTDDVDEDRQGVKRDRHVEASNSQERRGVSNNCAPVRKNRELDIDKSSLPASETKRTVGTRMTVQLRLKTL